MSHMFSSEFDIYTGLLEAFPLPTEKINEVNLSYDYNHPKFDTLKRLYPIESVAGDGDDFSKAVNLLKWVSAHNYHNSDFIADIPNNALDFLNYSHDKDSSCGINCKALSTILSECLLSIGIKARRIYIMPCSPYTADNHVVVNAFIKETNKWVMLDPTSTFYVSNEQGEYLSVLELRSHLASQKPIFFSKDAKYNDDIWTAEKAEEVTTYLSKNLFFVQTPEISGFDAFEIPENRTITLCPQGYDPKRVALSNVNYRMSLIKDPRYAETLAGNAEYVQWLNNYKAILEKRVYHYCSAVEFE